MKPHRTRIARRPLAAFALILAALAPLPALSQSSEADRLIRDNNRSLNQQLRDQGERNRIDSQIDSMRARSERERIVEPPPGSRTTNCPPGMIC
jgi:hypothetical protein